MLRSMLRRSLPSLVCSALLLGAPSARADVSGPNERTVPSEVVFTGLRDFPAHRFVIAVSSHRPSPDELANPALPPPTPVREGEPVSTDTIYFQELRALPVDTPDPVTDAWVLGSRAPTSGVFTRHPRRVPFDSRERVTRARFHVRQIQAGWVSLELLSIEAVMADGSDQPLARLIPGSHAIEWFEAPPGWQLFLMPDPSWPRAEPSPPAIPCNTGDVLPSFPGPRTLVAVQGSVGPDGSLDGKPHLAWGRPLNPWHREEVSLDSPAVARQLQIEVQVRPGSKLEISTSERFQDAQGRWFHDEDMTIPVDVPVRWAWYAAGGGAGAALLLAGAWAWRRRRRARAPGAT